MAKKPSLGRQKIKIAKIEIKNHLQVTFSKRRSGLFKKASELCTLCGVEVAIIVFSPAGKVFSFGHPNVEAIVEKFFSRIPSQNSTTNNLIEAHRYANLCELNLQLTQLINEFEIEKIRGESQDQNRKSSHKQWWEAPIDELGLDELSQLKVSMKELKENVAGYQINKLQAESETNSSPYFFLDNIGIGDLFKSKPNVVSASIGPVVPKFGYGYGIF